MPTKEARERQRGRLRRLAMHWAYVGQMTSSSEAARPPGSTPSLEAAWDGPTGSFEIKARRDWPPDRIVAVVDRLVCSKKST